MQIELSEKDAALLIVALSIFQSRFLEEPEAMVERLSLALGTKDGAEICSFGFKLLVVSEEMQVRLRKGFPGMVSRCEVIKATQCGQNRATN